MDSGENNVEFAQRIGRLYIRSKWHCLQLTHYTTSNQKENIFKPQSLTCTPSTVPANSICLCSMPIYGSDFCTLIVDKSVSMFSAVCTGSLSTLSDSRLTCSAPEPHRNCANFSGNCTTVHGPWNSKTDEWYGRTYDSDRWAGIPFSWSRWCSGVMCNVNLCEMIRENRTTTFRYRPNSCNWRAVRVNCNGRWWLYRLGRHSDRHRTIWAFSPIRTHSAYRCCCANFAPCPSPIEAHADMWYYSLSHAVAATAKCFWWNRNCSASVSHSAGWNSRWPWILGREVASDWICTSNWDWRRVEVECECNLRSTPERRRKLILIFRATDMATHQQRVYLFRVSKVMKLIFVN